MNRDRLPRSGLRLKVEEEFLAAPLTRRLARTLAPEPVPPAGPADYPDYGRGELLVTRHRGGFLKPCPGTRDYTCCGLTIFHFGLGCTLGCRYCILEAYLGTAALVLFGNVGEGLADLERTLNGPEDRRPLRVCTGEFTDSLLLDPRSGLAAEMIGIFASSRSLLELKTKTDHVDHLLKLDHRGRTVLSFSVNAPEIVRREESRAAPLEARLKAAARAAEAGYPLGLHFDPLIDHPGWEDGYARTAELIARHLQGAKVAWISLGCFRYLPNLKEIMLARHPETTIYDAEFITAGDGKKRYPRPRRTIMYRRLLDLLRPAVPPDTAIYLCMESPRLWRDVFGRALDTEGLTAFLDRRARELTSYYD